MIKILRKYDDNFSLSRATFIIGLATLLTKFVSLLRVNLFASRLAAGDLADVYFTSFRIPDFIFNLLILGTMSVAFIPLYVQFKSKNKDEALEFANTILNVSFLVMCLVLVVVYFFIGEITKFLVPGFPTEKLLETVKFSKLLLISPLIFTVSNLFTAILTSHKRFLVISLAPILYNIGIILGIVFLYPIFGFKGLAYGVILGALLHLTIQIPELIRVGYSYKFVLKIKDAKFKNFINLFLPRIFAFDSSSISLIIGSVFGSALGVGAIAVYNYAFDLQSVPLGIFAASTAAAAFPVLTSAHANGNLHEFIETLRKSILKILYYVLPISVMFLVFRAQIVRILLGHGKFGWDETILTFNALGIFSLSLASQALIPLLSRSFYAKHNTKIPVIVGALAMLINITLASYLHNSLGIIGIVAAFSISNSLNCIILFLLLRFKFLAPGNSIYLEEYFDNPLVKNVVLIVLSSGLFGVVIYGMLYLMSVILATNTTLGLFIQTGISGITGVIIYLGITKQMKLEESLNLWKIVERIVRYIR